MQAPSLVGLAGPSSCGKTELSQAHYESDAAQAAAEAARQQAEQVCEQWGA
jgi:hypothetical protein